MKKKKKNYIPKTKRTCIKTNQKAIFNIPDELFISVVKSGKSGREMAEFFGTSQNAVHAQYQRIERTGIKLNPNKIVGRKRFNGRDEEEIKKKLEYAWSIGMSDDETCGFVELSRATYQGYLAENEDLKEKRGLLRLKPRAQARSVVVRDLYDVKVKDEKGDYVYDKKGNHIIIKASKNFALRYLSKTTIEFSDKTETHHSGSIGSGIEKLNDSQIDEQIGIIQARLLNRMTKRLKAPGKANKQDAVEAELVDDKNNSEETQ